MTIENKIDVVIVGAGAAGLMCAIEASKRGKRVLVIEKSKKIAGKIFISGGGRCNFTNIYTQPKCYVSHNHHFCKSALSRYTYWDFLALLTKHDLSWHEKEPKNLAGYLSDNNQGQLFCDQKSQAIIDALLSECEDNEVQILTSTQVQSLNQCSNQERLYHVVLTSTVTDIYHDIYCNSVVIATGGPSIPKMGATEFARDIAKQFDLNFYPFIPALVPLVLSQEMKQQMCYPLAGVSLWVEVSASHKVYGKQMFKENLLITHKGLSGPAILQISSYWQSGSAIRINLLPEIELYDVLQDAKNNTPQKKLSTILKPYWPTKWLSYWLEAHGGDKTLQELTKAAMHDLSDKTHHWQVMPVGTEGMAKAEVSSGGIDCNELSSQTFMAKKQEGLYFIGEAIDVTGFLGGYNFQWAWASGWCAGQFV